MTMTTNACDCSADVPCLAHVADRAAAELDSPAAVAADLAAVTGEIDMAGPVLAAKRHLTLEEAQSEGLELGWTFNHYAPCCFETETLILVATLDELQAAGLEFSIHPPSSPLCAVCGRRYSAQEARAGFDVCEHCQ